MHSPTPPPTPPWAYTRAQRAGLALLLLFIGLCWGIQYAVDRPAINYNPSADEALGRLADSLRQLTRVAETTRPAAVVEAFPFDPNKVTVSDLQRLGLSEKQATAFVRYRERRPFRQARDIRSLYVLRPEQADRLVGLARLPESNGANTTRTTPTASSSIRTTLPPQRFPFDPNTLPKDSLQLLGLTERQASALIKYRSYRPTTFRRPADLHRLGTLDSQLVDDLEPFVQIALPPSAAPAAPPPAPEPININAATIEQWQQLPGIGPYRAAQIVKFRDRLGGFVSREQVATTYGLPDSSYQTILPYLRLDPIRKPLYVNQLDAEALSRHPYLDRRTAEIIVRYRSNHGPFAGPTDLENVRALSAEGRSKLLPYLNFDR